MSERIVNMGSGMSSLRGFTTNNIATSANESQVLSDRSKPMGYIVYCEDTQRLVWYHSTIGKWYGVDVTATEQY